MSDGSVEVCGGDRRFATAVLHFDTAWSPPTPIVKLLGDRYPSLDFCLLYFECGEGFAGIYVVEAGMVTLDIHGDYSGDRGG